MSQKNLDDYDDLLSFCHSYMDGALTLVDQDIIKKKTITGIAGQVLAAHFLMAHATELYVKTYISLLGRKPDTKSHNLMKLLNILESLYKKHYKRKILSRKSIKLIDYLNRNSIFRYPRDKEWQYLPAIFNETKKWSAPKAKKFFNDWNSLADQLKNLGYSIATKLDYN